MARTADIQGTVGTLKIIESGPFGQTFIERPIDDLKGLGGIQLQVKDLLRVTSEFEGIFDINCGHYAPLIFETNILWAIASLSERSA